MCGGFWRCCHAGVRNRAGGGGPGPSQWGEEGLTGISPTAVSPEARARGCVAWDRERRLSFAVPFMDMKPVVHLDLFLPRVTELALSAGDRHTKVLASHSPWSAMHSLGDMCYVSWPLCFPQLRDGETTQLSEVSILGQWKVNLRNLNRW